MNLEYYLSLNYKKTIFQDEDGDYIIEVPDLPGCAADGSTPAEAFENLREAMSSWMSSRIAAGLEIPEPRVESQYSGKVLLRMPQYLHRRLSQQAELDGISLNQYMVSLLTDASAMTSAAHYLKSRVGLFTVGTAESIRSRLESCLNFEFSNEPCGPVILGTQANVVCSEPYYSAKTTFRYWSQYVGQSLKPKQLTGGIAENPRDAFPERSNLA
jgi:antitoxin HicB